MLRKDFFLIFIGIFLLNIYGTFGLEFLRKDDWLRYSLVCQDKIDFKFGSVYDFFYTNIRYLFYYLLFESPTLARFAVLIFLQIPTSCLIFLLIKKAFPKIESSILIATAILPTGLVMQTFFPTFLDGSYRLVGIQLSLFSVLLMSMKARKLLILDIIPILLFYFALVGADTVVFLIPTYFYLLYRFHGGSKRFYWQISTLLFLGLGWAAKAFFFPRVASATVSEIQPKVMIERASNYIQSSLPFPFFTFGEKAYEYFPSFISFPFFSHFIKCMIIIAFCILCLVLSYYIICRLLIYFKISLNCKGNKMQFDLHFVLFGIFWFLSNISVFVFVSRDFATRYQYIAAYGLVLCCVYILCYCLSFLTGRVNCKLLLTLVFLGCLLQRILGLYLFFKPFNVTQHAIKSELSEKYFPENAQIGIRGNFKMETDGYPAWSSGFFQFCLNRKDITGVLPVERSFFNPFEQSPWTIGANFNPNKPIFIFNFVNNRKLVPIEYLLSWQKDKWELFKLDIDSGKIKKTKVGKKLSTLRREIEGISMIKNKKDPIYGYRYNSVHISDF